MNLFLKTKADERTVNSYVKYKFVKELILDAIGLIVVIAAIISTFIMFRDIVEYIGRFLK